ncbi:unnamed protein product [Anisakis simplex]|uniref:N-acetyltransferase domain-containing protein n=1 Tax=Anisakis simplex TaxID=6269 RepID=A0A0M3JBN4_ANISI|nr:unnamed protein product [Anisakis simplex]
MIVEPTKPNQQIQQLGNKTECGLLGFVQNIGGDYAEIRRKFPEESLHKVYTFNSTRKSMMTVIKLYSENGTEVGYRVYQKGAAELVLARCSHFIGSDLSVNQFDHERRQQITSAIITNMAELGLRTICIAYKDYIRKSFRDAEHNEVSFFTVFIRRIGSTFM